MTSTNKTEEGGGEEGKEMLESLNKEIRRHQKRLFCEVSFVLPDDGVEHQNRSKKRFIIVLLCTF